MSESGEGEERELLFTEWNGNVDGSFEGQFGRVGIGGGSRGPGELVGDNWDDHRVEGEDGSQQIEAGPAAEERFGEPSREGQKE